MWAPGAWFPGLWTPPFENPSNSQWAGFHFVGSTPDPRNPFGSRSVAEPIDSLQLQVLDKTQISIFAEASPPESTTSSCFASENRLPRAQCGFGDLETEIMVCAPGTYFPGTPAGAVVFEQAI